MGLFVIIRAIVVRLIFAIHGMTAIWRVYMVTGNAKYWLMCFALVGLLGETIFTILKKSGQEWKW